jgi:hypothetical protein
MREVIQCDDGWVLLLYVLIIHRPLLGACSLRHQQQQQLDMAHREGPPVEDPLALIMKATSCISFQLFCPTMDGGAFDDDDSGAGIAGLEMVSGPIVAPSASMPEFAPHTSVGAVATFAQVRPSGRDATNEAEGADDEDGNYNFELMEKQADKERHLNLRENRKPRPFGAADRVLSDDVFRELIDSVIRDFEQEHAHITKHYSAKGGRTSFSKVKCSGHAVQVISDAFEDFLMKILKRAYVFFSARVRTKELLDDLTLKANTFGADNRMLINMRICNEAEIKRKKERDMIESIQRQRDDDAAAEEDGLEGDEAERAAAQRVEQKKANSKIVTMEEVNREREIMARKGDKGLLVRTRAVKLQQSFVSTLPVELEKLYADTELIFKKISEHALSGQEVSNVHEIQAEIKKTALRFSRLQESEWRAFRLDDLIPIMDDEPTLRRKMVTLYGHELVQAKNNSLIQEELKRRRDDANLNEEKEDEWMMIKKLCSASEDLTDAARRRLEDELTLKYSQDKLVLPAAVRYYKTFIEGSGGKGSTRKVHPAEHRSSSITSMLSSKVAVQRLPQGVSREEVETFLTRLNVFGLKSIQFDSHGANAVLEFHMPQFAQECVLRVDDQRMRASDSETLKVELYETTKLEPGYVLIAERYEKDVTVAAVNQIVRNISNFRGTCKPVGASHCFVEFVDSSSCASALNKLHAMGNEIYFRYVTSNELRDFSAAREKEKQDIRRQYQVSNSPPKTGLPSAALQNFAEQSSSSVLQSAPSALPPRQLTSTVLPLPPDATSNVPAIFLLASGIPLDIGLDELKQRLCLFSGCLIQTLKSRPSQKDPSQHTSLSFQEIQVQFRDDASANECHRAIHGRPFMDNRPEYGPVKAVVKKQKPPTITIPKVLQALPSQPFPSPASIVEVGTPEIHSASSSNPVSQSSGDMLTFLGASNIPLIPKEEIYQRFTSFAGFVGTKVEIRQDTKNPGACTIRARFEDLASAQRCRDALNGRAFSPQHDVGAVRVYIKQITKEQLMQERQSAQKSQTAPQQNQHYMPQEMQLQQPQVPSQAMQPIQYIVPSAHQMQVNYAQAPMQSYTQPSEVHLQQATAPSTHHMTIAHNQMPGAGVQQGLHMSQGQPQQQVLHMSQGQPQQMMQHYHSVIPQNMRPQQNTQIMAAQHAMPPPTQPHQYYQQNMPMHMQHQQYVQVAPQQIHPQTQQYAPAQQYSMQHMPAQQYSYQQQSPVVQCAQASSPTAAELQQLDEEERETQERMNKLNKLKQAGQ